MTVMMRLVKYLKKIIMKTDDCHDYIDDDDHDCGDNNIDDDDDNKDDT